MNESNAINDGPSFDCFPITPADTAIVNPESIASPVRGFRVAVAGNVKYRTLKGKDRTIAVLAGEVIPVATDLIYATGTTATGFIGYV